MFYWISSGQTLHDPACSCIFVVTDVPPTVCCFLPKPCSPSRCHTHWWLLSEQHSIVIGLLVSFCLYSILYAAARFDHVTLFWHPLFTFFGMDSMRILMKILPLHKNYLHVVTWSCCGIRCCFLLRRLQKSLKCQFPCALEARGRHALFCGKSLWQLQGLDSFQIFNIFYFAFNDGYFCGLEEHMLFVV